MRRKKIRSNYYLLKKHRYSKFSLFTQKQDIKLLNLDQF